MLGVIFISFLGKKGDTIWQFLKMKLETLTM